MGKKSFMEWQDFFGRIPEQVQYWFFQDAVQGVLRFSGLCKGRYEWLSKGGFQLRRRSQRRIELARRK